MKDDKKYNGWTNYATWRVNLEIFDGYNIDDNVTDVEYLADRLGEELMEILSQNCTNDLTLSYAIAFCDDVNFTEIAQHIINTRGIKNER